MGPQRFVQDLVLGPTSRFIARSRNASRVARVTPDFGTKRTCRCIGEVLGWAEAGGFRKPQPLPTRWKNHLDCSPHTSVIGR